MFVPHLNCKICGGEIAPDAEHNNGACLGCGAECMYPKADVKKLNRITYLRNELNFKRAELFADETVEDSSEDSEVYLNRFLCRYGIQYIRNGAKRFPVCRVNPSTLSEVSEDEDYKRALYYATEDMQSHYMNIGNAISEAVSVSRNVFAQDKKYDVFVLSRENADVDSDLDGDRLFLRFTENLGFSVFYAPEVLKDMDETEKAAQIAYALENSRIMLANFKDISDCYDGYMNYAINTFIAAMASDDQKIIFPIFNSTNIRFQQLPEELVWYDEVFDSADGEFMREISEKVEMILKPEEAAVVPDSIVTATAANKENLIKRAYMFLEDGEFDTADTYFDKILDIDIEDSRAYIGKLLAEYKLSSEDQIPTIPQPITDDKNYIKALRFATPEQKARYEALNGEIVAYIESEKKRISEEHQRLAAEREEKEEIERQRRARQLKEERKLEFQRRRDPLRKTLVEIRSELNKTFLTPKRKAELKEQEETVVRNIKDLEAQFPDIWD